MLSALCRSCCWFRVNDEWIAWWLSSCKDHHLDTFNITFEGPLRVWLDFDKHVAEREKSVSLDRAAQEAYRNKKAGGLSEKDHMRTAYNSHMSSLSFYEPWGTTFNICQGWTMSKSAGRKSIKEMFQEISIFFSLYSNPNRWSFSIDYLSWEIMEVFREVQDLT